MQAAVFVKLSTVIKRIKCAQSYVYVIYVHTSMPYIFKGMCVGVCVHMKCAKTHVVAQKALAVFNCWHKT